MSKSDQPVSFLQRRTVGERHVPRGPSTRAVRSRVYMAMAMFGLVYLAIGGRLVMLGFSEEAETASYISAQDSVAAGLNRVSPIRSSWTGSSIRHPRGPGSGTGRERKTAPASASCTAQVEAACGGASLFAPVSTGLA